MTHHPSGEQLYEELCAAARAAGIRVDKFVEPLWPGCGAGWKLEQMRIAKKPLQRTVDRVRALIRGEEVEPPSNGQRQQLTSIYQALTRSQAEALGLPPSGRAIRDARHIEIQQRHRQRTELLRYLTERAHEDRRPGQTIADRVCELRREVEA